MNPLSELLDIVLFFIDTHRQFVLLAVVLALVGLIAIAANVMEPSQASFRGLG